MTGLLNVAKRVPCTLVEGPGRRYALWVQGCNIGCPNCCNPELLAFERRQVVSAAQICDEIQEAKVAWRIEGVTFSGR